MVQPSSHDAQTPWHGPSKSHFHDCVLHEGLEPFSRERPTEIKAPQCQLREEVDPKIACTAVEQTIRYSLA
jgi:hypothetical protein